MGSLAQRDGMAAFLQELERMMTGLVSMKEKKLTQIEADKAALKCVRRLALIRLFTG
jgi:hypothetical protein